MSSTCFEPEGSSSGRRLYMQLQYGTFRCIGTNSLLDRRVCSINACKTYHTITAYTTVFLKMSPWGQST